MIQRIQTIYLVLAALCLLALLLVDDLWAGPLAEAVGWFSVTMLFGVGLLSLGALAAIFLYKNRAQQRSVVMGLQVGALVLAVLVFVAAYLADALSVMGAEGFDVSRLLLLALPLLAVVFFMLARRGIERDIALVRSMDRLR